MYDRRCAVTVSRKQHETLTRRVISTNSAIKARHGAPIRSELNNNPPPVERINVFSLVFQQPAKAFIQDQETHSISLEHGRPWR